MHASITALARKRIEQIVTFLPSVIPGVSASTMKPVRAFDAGAPFSEFERARTKNLRVQVDRVRFASRHQSYERTLLGTLYCFR